MPRNSPLRKFLIASALAMSTATAAPPLTLIQDTLYKADGTRFDGVAQIEWKTFQAGDGSEIPQQMLSVRVALGNLRVMLVPTTNALRTVTYTVRFNSDGRTQFTEHWAVPPSAAPLRLRDIRTIAPGPGNVTTPPANVAIAEVVGLRTELDLRPARGAGYLAARTAVIGSSGALEGALGAPGDCIKVDGTSGPCGIGSLIFIDGESPSGAINSANRTFTLAGVPAPASSLSLFHNGVLIRQGSEYTLSGNTVTLAAGRAPIPGDYLQAWYRLAGSPTPGLNYIDNETPQGVVNGVNATYNVQAVPVPASSLKVFRNGLLQKLGVDYNISVNTVTFTPVSIPQLGDILQVSYRTL